MLQSICSQYAGSRRKKRTDGGGRVAVGPFNKPPNEVPLAKYVRVIGFRICQLSRSELEEMTLADLYHYRKGVEDRMDDRRRQSLWIVNTLRTAHSGGDADPIKLEELKKSGEKRTNKERFNNKKDFLELKERVDKLRSEAEK